MKKWKTKDNRYLDVSEMTTQHIENCINMLNRTVSEMNPPIFQGEMAQWQAETQYDSFIREVNDYITEFEKELKKRNETIHTHQTITRTIRAFKK